MQTSPDAPAAATATATGQDTDMDLADWGRAHKEARREKRASTLQAVTQQAQDDPALARFTHHTAIHWSTMLLGERLDYWPSTGRWRWRGRTSTGGLQSLLGFIRKREQPPESV